MYNDVKVGLEVEVHLIDSNGTISNRADEVVNHPWNDAGIAPELSRSMVELITAPYSDLSEVYQDLLHRFERLKDITQDLGLGFIPASSLHNEGEIQTRDHERPRGLRKRIILGEASRELEHHLAGTHVHIEKIDSEELAYKQYLLMQAMDPVFAFMSSSPFFNGENSKKDYRVEMYRNIVFREFPLQGQLLDYPGSLAEATERQRQAYLQFRKVLESRGLDTEGINEVNCIWGPLRLSSFGTIESRASDANKPENVIALAALYKGVTNYIIQNNPEIIVDHSDSRPAQDLFLGSEGRIFIPSYQRLKKFESDGIVHGLEDGDLASYLSNILSVSSSGLGKINYLDPFKKMILERRTLSDEIVSVASEEGLERDHKITGEGAKLLRRYLANSYALPKE